MTSSNGPEGSLQKVIAVTKEGKEVARQKIIDEIRSVVRSSPANQRKDHKGPYFDEPLVGFADAMDPIFTDYKRIIGSFHMTPREWFDLEFGAGSFQAGTVISWILPVQEGVRRANRAQKTLPSLPWSHTRFHGEHFNEELRRQVVRLLSDLGYRTVAPALHPNWERFRDPRVGYASKWSERHAAHAAGLGTFSLSDGLITERGIAHRTGSVVTELVLEPTARPYQDPYSYCLKYNSNTCGTCITRCPAGAISDKGHDKDICFTYMKEKVGPAVNEEYAVSISGCGLCQTRVPCEKGIPKTPKRRGRTGRDR
jgi:epoxyqueuosine reductase